MDFTNYSALQRSSASNSQDDICFKIYLKKKFNLKYFRKKFKKNFTEINFDKIKLKKKFGWTKLKTI